MDLLQMPIPYWNKTTLISYLQRRILVNCIAYYVLDNPLWTDKKYDKEAKQLQRIMEGNKKEAEMSDYWYCMYDFAAATGFDLYHRLNKHDEEYLTNITIHLIHLIGSRYNDK